MRIAAAPARLCAGVRAQTAFFLCCLFFCGTVSAMWAALSDDELIRTSDLIVVGEWQGQTTFSAPSFPEAAIGVIAISEVLRGPGNPAFALVILPSDKKPRSSSDPAFHRGDRGLWLLRLKPDSQGLYLVDHPQRFVSGEGESQRIRQLRQLIKP